LFDIHNLRQKAQAARTPLTKFKLCGIRELGTDLDRYRGANDASLAGSEHGNGFVRGNGVRENSLVGHRLVRLLVPVPARGQFPKSQL